MYLYYFLAAMGPSLQPYLWWKKYITQLQLVQFVIVIIHGSQVIFYKDCDFPATYGYVIVGLAFYFLVLFSFFYLSTYKQAKKSVTNGINGLNKKTK